MLDVRHIALALACSFAGACTLDPSPTRDDELDQPGGSAVTWGDGGTSMEELFVPVSPPPIPERERALPGHDCHDACPDICGDGEACCASTQQCIALECRECCPDADFGFAELAYGGR